jgi:hypothetical protein
MLRWYRARSRAVARLLLAALASLAAATAAPHADDCRDALCVADVVGHEAADHSVEAPPAPDDHALHCIVCHWIRAFKPAIQSTTAAAPSIPDVVRVHPPFSGALSAFRAAQPPLRSPPSAPALITL